MHLPVLFLVTFGVALLIALVGGLMLLVAAFRQSVVWGLVTLFVPCGQVVFLCVHWAEARKVFLISLLGTALCLGSVLTVGEVRAGLAGGNLPALFSGHSTPPPDPVAQIAEKRAQLEAQNAAFAQDGAELGRQFAVLEARRTALPAGDAATLEKFNADAAAYQVRTTRRKQMYSEIETAQRALDALLAARPAVVMYCTSHCPACVMVKQYFARKGVSYQEIDVETSPAGREAFERLGGRGVPLILVGEKRLEGFSEQALDAML